MTAPIAKAATSAALIDHLPQWLDFWAKLAAAIAWPVAVVTLAILFAGGIRRILQRVSQFKGFGF